MPVFGLLKRGGEVYTRIIPNASSATLHPIIERKVVPDSIVYSGSWSGYNALDVSDFKHLRINHSERFADRRNHIDGIESFWSQAKRRMRRLNGIPRDSFPLFLEECEWRSNTKSPERQRRQLEQWVRKHLS